MSEGKKPPFGVDNSEISKIDAIVDGFLSSEETFDDSSDFISGDDGSDDYSGVIRRSDLPEVLVVTKSHSFVPKPLIEDFLRSDLYLSKLEQIPEELQLKVDAVCRGNDLLICEFFTIVRDFGEVGVEIVLNFNGVYERSDATVSTKLGEIAIIRAVIKLIKSGVEEMFGNGQLALVFLRNLALTAGCRDLKQLTDMLTHVQDLVQYSKICCSLERALTIEWNYLELVLFLENFRYIRVAHGPVLAGEQMRAYLESAQEGGVRRDFLN